jgi:hypothetical protein
MQSLEIELFSKKQAEIYTYFSFSQDSPKIKNHLHMYAGSIDLIRLQTVIYLVTQSLYPSLIHHSVLLPSQCSDIINSNCLKLTIPGFPYNLLPVSCDDIGFLKKA